MSYLLDFCRMTSSTGGTGTLTLTAQTGYPDIAAAITGTRLVSYAIAEYTSSAKTQLAQGETGIGSYVASTGVLTRTAIKSTWDGSAYLPKFGTATAPTALNFGSTAANIDITVSPVTAQTLPGIPFYYGTVASVADGLGLTACNMQGSGTFSLSTGVVSYFQYLLIHNGPFSQFSVRSNGASVSGGSPTLDCSVYEIGSTGVPGKRLISFTQITAFAGGASSTYTSTALATPVALMPGWYYVGLLYTAGGGTGSPSIKGAASQWGCGPQGSLLSTTSASGTPLVTGSLADPATTPTSAVATAPGYVFLK